MRCSRGDLVAIPFPYSDLAARKRRPVLVITDPDRHGDFIGLAVTSVPTKDLALAIGERSMVAGNLPKASWVRCDKMFTLSRSVVAGWYGSVSNEVLG
jgi:mRNA interferase MazF